MKVLLKRFMKDERGLELSEYAVMMAMLLVAVITVVGALGSTIAAAFQNLITAMGGAV